MKEENVIEMESFFLKVNERMAFAIGADYSFILGNFFEQQFD